ncbi:hypothetical protein NPIL_447651 [Nephila pilipes]|uniref:Uncharacterized protein n=1 Tax=Nephila pilipes TaxID=299642 RepID=A0A8X6N741_NEPPI|nr:hypothetical protein NPIL_447651 [Nephila pilipes]
MRLLRLTQPQLPRCHPPSQPVSPIGHSRLPIYAARGESLRSSDCILEMRSRRRCSSESASGAWCMAYLQED